jgi:hypothetical protein
MSWLYSRALVAEYSGAICSDGEPCAQWSVMPTPQGFWRNDKMMEFSSLSRFGVTLQLLTEDRGKELLMSYLAAFHAKTSASQAKAQESADSAADYGGSLPGLLAKYDLATHSLKTVQLSLFEGLELSLATWPRWGLMRNGECFLAKMSVECTCETGFGLSLPTIGANEWKGAAKRRYLGSPDFRGAKMSEGLRICETDPIYLNPLFAELTMMWPLGWTDLKPLGMAKFQEWLQQHLPH